MASGFGKRFSSATALEKAIIAVLVLVLAADVAIIAFGRADDAPPRESGTNEPAGATVPGTTTTTAPTTTSSDAGGVPPCSEVADPGPSDDAVRCSTRSATLLLGGEDRPLLLGGTQVRLLSASSTPASLILRLRVRNETGAEQGIIAGGQEIYVNLNGVRLDAAPSGDVRVPTMEGVTTTLRFPLTPGRAALLRRLGGRAELGVRPWDEQPAEKAIGVLRFRVTPPPAA
ncbi:MAG TPA: hypothetical protein VF587_17325 [Solirubrobacteraceae bacterium]|jgi:hypothetical protein